MNNHNFLNAISNPEQVQSASRACVIKLNHAQQQQCLLLHKGRVQLRDAATGQVLETVNAPYILGHGHQLMGHELHLEMMADALYEIVPSDTFYRKMEHHNRWQELLGFMLHLPNRPSLQRAEKRARQDRTILSQLDSMMFNSAS